MQNYKISIDISSVQKELLDYDLRDFRFPFSTHFVEAANPDEACNMIRNRIINMLLKKEDTTESRLLCERIKREMRIDKIECP